MRNAETREAVHAAWVAAGDGYHKPDPEMMEELLLYLTSHLMVRRLKEAVMTELPKLHRQLPPNWLRPSPSLP